MSLFCTLHRHESLEAARACREAQLRASADLKLMLAGMPPRAIPLRHWPARAEKKGQVTLWVFSEAAPRAPLVLSDAEADTLDELEPLVVSERAPGAKRKVAKVKRGGKKAHKKAAQRKGR